MRLFYGRMDTVLGLFGMALWIVGTIGIATGVTYLVVKLFPGDDDLKPKSES
jgi:hypothetical protein